MKVPGLDTGSGTVLWQRWSGHAEANPEAEAIVHWVAGAEPYRWRRGDLLEAAKQQAERLCEAGVGAGDVCALMLRHHPRFYPLYMGVSALGAIPAVLAYPNARLHPDKFRQGFQGMAHRSGLNWLLTERELSALVEPCLQAQHTTVRKVLFPLEWMSGKTWEAGAGKTGVHMPTRIHAGQPALLQHSSGTTGLQKAVVLSHRAVLEHVRRYARAIGLKARDKIVSWLPFYHDMGLIAAFHLPLASGTTIIQLDPFEWVTAPVLLLEAISREKATLAWLPNFAYSHMAARIHEEDMEGIRLDSVRLLVNCSEPVRYESHEQFARRFVPHGLRRDCLGACYAMAETTFAVTQSKPGRQTRYLRASRAALAQGIYRPPAENEALRMCASSGRLISGCEARVYDEAGQEQPDGVVGEIRIRSLSLFDGYHNNPEKTAEVLKDGWYCSGDLGFQLDGEFYVIGRKKDIIIVAGKNLYPEDIEDAVSTVPGILPGRVVAFGTEDPELGTEVVCVVAETEEGEVERRKALSLQVIEAGMRIDVSVGRVYLAPPRWLIKSSAGKPSRRANRERAVGELQAI